jgi:hypothetical protein
MCSAIWSGKVINGRPGGLAAFDAGALLLDDEFIPMVASAFSSDLAESAAQARLLTSSGPVVNGSLGGSMPCQQSQCSHAISLQCDQGGEAIDGKTAYRHQHSCRACQAVGAEGRQSANSLMVDFRVGSQMHIQSTRINVRTASEAGID